MNSIPEAVAQKIITFSPGLANVSKFFNDAANTVAYTVEIESITKKGNYSKVNKFYNERKALLYFQSEVEEMEDKGVGGKIMLYDKNNNLDEVFEMELNPSAILEEWQQDWKDYIEEGRGDYEEEVRFAMENID